MKYLHTALAACWIFGIGLNAAYKIPTSKVNLEILIIFVIFVLEQILSAEVIVPNFGDGMGLT